MQYSVSESSSMHISFAGIFVIGAIVLFGSMLLSSILGFVTKNQDWTRPGRLAGALGGIALLLIVFLGVFRFRVQHEVTPSAEQYAPNISQQWQVSTGERSLEPQAAFAPVWRKMLMLALLFGVPIIFLLRCAHKHRWHAHFARHGHFVFPLLLIPLGLFFFWFAVGTPREAAMVKTTWPERQGSIPPNQYQGVIPVHAQSRPKKSDKTVEKEEESTSTTQSESTSQPAEKPEAEKIVAAENLPNWVHDSPQRKDDAYYEVVSSVRSDPMERYNNLNLKLIETANLFIDGTILRQPGASKYITVDADYLREHCNAGEFESQTAGQSYFRLKFDKNFRGMIEQQYRAFIAQDHLQQLGTAGLVAFAALGGLYVFLRATPNNSGGKSANSDAAIPRSTT